MNLGFFPQGCEKRLQNLSRFLFLLKALVSHKRHCWQIFSVLLPRRKRVFAQNVQGNFPNGGVRNAGTDPAGAEASARLLRVHRPSRPPRKCCRGSGSATHLGLRRRPSCFSGENQPLLRMPTCRNPSLVSKRPLTPVTAAQRRRALLGLAWRPPPQRLGPSKALVPSGLNLSLAWRP